MSSKSFALLLLVFPLAACSTLKETQTAGPGALKTRSLYQVETVKIETGMASWYRDRRTASMERFDGNAMAAAQNSQVRHESPGCGPQDQQVPHRSH